ncbi:hypothetical protein M8C21_018931, partial [Ambrosia artemisiifolia]
SADNEEKNRNPKAHTSPFYQQETSLPCPLSSSIYYGGQDIYTNPSITKNNPGHNTPKMEKMMGVLQEEIGGRDHSITKTTLRTYLYDETKSRLLGKFCFPMVVIDELLLFRLFSLCIHRL